jgi:hypothetical protein
LKTINPGSRTTFVKRDGALLFAERLLHVNWVDERALS